VDCSDFSNRLVIQNNNSDISIKRASYWFLLNAITYNRCPYVVDNNKAMQIIKTIGEADHRFVKWETQNMLGFKSFKYASQTLPEIEIILM
jgi:transposase-like protein